MLDDCLGEMSGQGLSLFSCQPVHSIPMTAGAIEGRRRQTLIGKEGVFVNPLKEGTRVHGGLSASRGGTPSPVRASWMPSAAGSLQSLVQPASVSASAQCWGGPGVSQPGSTSQHRSGLEPQPLGLAGLRPGLAGLGPPGPEAWSKARLEKQDRAELALERQSGTVEVGSGLTMPRWDGDRDKHVSWSSEGCLPGARTSADG